MKLTERLVLAFIVRHAIGPEDGWVTFDGSELPIKPKRHRKTIARLVRKGLLDAGVDENGFFVEPTDEGVDLACSWARAAMH